jgi:hypothetical protein
MLKLKPHPSLSLSWHIDSIHFLEKWHINPLNAELNPVCHLLALLGAHPILHISKIRVKVKNPEQLYC